MKRTFKITRNDGVIEDWSDQRTRDTDFTITLHDTGLTQSGYIERFNDSGGECITFGEIEKLELIIEK